MRPVPDVLRGRAFTRAQAHDAGVTDRMLERSRFVRLHAGVYRTADTPASLELLVDAALLALPPGTAVSHTTNLRLRGIDVGRETPVHVASQRGSRRGLEGVTYHRYQGKLDVEEVNGRPLLTVSRTFVDSATLLRESELLRLGDALVALGLVTAADLWGFCIESHLDGVQRARRVAPWVRAGVASPRESDVRWILVRAGLPEPEVNVEILDEHGTWVARGDLVYRREKVLVEYDGWQHERDAHQRQWDHLRREQLEAAGWRVIVVTTADLRRPGGIVARVRQALRLRGTAV